MTTFKRRGKTSPNSPFGCEPSPTGSSRCKKVQKKQELWQGRPGAKLNIPQAQLVGYKGSPTSQRQRGWVADLLWRGPQTPAPPALVHPGSKDGCRELAGHWPSLSPGAKSRGQLSQPPAEPGFEAG